MKRLREAWQWLHRPDLYLTEAFRREGPTFRRRLPVVGEILFTGDPELIASIVRNPHLEGGRGIRALRRILGETSLIMLHGSPHTQRRKLLIPHFTDERMAPFDEQTLEVAREAFAKLPPGRPFSLFSLSCSILLRVILRILFGFLESRREERLVRAVERFLGSTRNPLALFVPPLQVDLGGWNAWGRALRNKRELLAAIDALLEEGLPSNALLAPLVTDPGQSGLKTEELRQEILSLLLFGHETTAASLSWVFAHVFSRPSLLESLRREREESLRLRGETEVDALPLARACVQESMRLNPVVLHLMRVARTGTKVGDHTLPAGSMAAPSPYLAHRNPALFHRPEEFLPQRFLEREDYPHAYFPFGLGNRICPGQHLALRQMTLLLSEAASLQELALVPGASLDPVRNMVLMIPRGGTRMYRGAKK